MLNHPQPNAPQPTAPQTRVGTLQRVLSGHPYFANWSADQLRQIEGHCELLEVNTNRTVLEVDALDPQIHFLISGGLELIDVDGQVRQVTGGDPDSHYPIARLRPSNYKVRATQPSILLEIEQSFLKRFAPTATQVRFVQDSRAVGGSWQSHPLVTEVSASLAAGKLELPVIPAIALKVRRALANTDYSTAQISQIISADPVISANLIQIANSALFKGVQECTSVQAAVVRLGMSKVQNIVLALSTATLFNTKVPALRKRLVIIWRHLVEVGAIASALAQLNGKLDSDFAMLAGLLHEIGKIPILQRAPRHADLADNPGLLDDIANGLGPMVSAEVLKAWDLAPPLIDACEQQHNWSYDHDGDCDVTDALLVAHILALIKEGARESLPRLDETPAFSKITTERLTPKQSMTVLTVVQAQTAELKQLLG